MGSSVLGQVKSAYLILFNLLLVGLWVTVLATTLAVLIQDAGASSSLPDLSTRVHAQAGYYVMIAQKVTWLEPVHVLLGLARGSLPAAVMQNFGRSMVLFTVLEQFQAARQCPLVISLYLAWAGSEIIRYPYYLFGQLSGGKSPPYWMTWLRYSGFIPLYPIGIVSEIWLYAVSLSDLKVAVRDRDLFSIRMPNQYNFAFDFLYFVYFGLCVLYPLSGPGLYVYMLSQRANSLKKAKAAAAGTDKKKAT